MDLVNSSHTYATGGTSVDEFWYQDISILVSVIFHVHFNYLLINCIYKSKNSVSSC